MNPDKCHLLITNCGNGVSINVDNEIIECRNSVKLLGRTIDNRLHFNDHISNLCKKVSVKLHSLASISNLMSHDKLPSILLYIQAWITAICIYIYIYIYIHMYSH